MRRASKVSLGVITYLILAAFFNLVSYSLDQFIVQGEDRMREYNNKLQIEKLRVSNLSNSLNIFQSMEYQLDSDANIMGNLWGFNNKASDLFYMYSNNLYDNEGIISDIELKKNSKNLSTFYQKKIEEFVDQINFKVNQFYIVFSENFSAGETYQLLKDNKVFLSYLNKPIFQIDKNLVKGLSSLDEDESYEKFSIVWDKIDKIYNTQSNINDFVLIINSEYLISINNYHDILNEFSKIKNLNNYLILSSILCQILGLFFLLFLFRTLIMENY